MGRSQPPQNRSVCVEDAEPCVINATGGIIMWWTREAYCHWGVSYGMAQYYPHISQDLIASHHGQLPDRQEEMAATETTHCPGTACMRHHCKCAT